MKHTLSLILAVAMLLSMAPVAFAADDTEFPIDLIWDEGYLLDEDDRYVDFDNPADDEVPYGETIYYPLLSDYVDSEGYDYTAVHESSAVKKVKIRTDWDEGSNYIDELSVVRKRFEGDLDDDLIDTSKSKYIYFLSITTKQRSKTTTAVNEVYGVVKLKKTGDNAFDYDDRQLDVGFDVGYTEPDEGNLIPIVPALFRPDENFDEYDEETFDFEADDNSYFVVNTNSQKKLVLGMDTDYDDDIGERFPDADLYFFNGNGGRFNKLGYLYLYTGDSDYRYAYSIDEDGNMEKVSATYDGHDDCVVIRTRTLGRYVISDEKLDVADNTDGYNNAEVVYDNDTQQNYNPGTGGWPWETPGYSDLVYQPPVEPAAPSAAPQPAAPAVIPAPVAPAAPEAAGQQPEQQQEATGPEVAETAVNVEEKAPVFSTLFIGENDGDAAPDTRMMLVIACCVGAIASAVGLVLCIAAAISKNRGRYY